jgi:hypothetical protein
MIEVIKTDQVVSVTKTDTTTNVAITNQQVTVLEQVAGVQGATGATGSSGVISVTSPITNSGTASAAIIGISTGLFKLSTTTFSSVSRVQMNNIFQSGIRNYIVKLDLSGSGGIGALTWQFRASGSTITTAAYAYDSMSLTTGASGAQATAATSVPWVNGGILSTGWQHTLDIYSPMISTIGTGFKSTGYGTYTSPTQVLTAGRYTTNAALDGLDIYFGGVTASGQVEIWGYV